jgi:hypothetical protein
MTAATRHRPFSREPSSEKPAWIQAIGAVLAALVLGVLGLFAGRATDTSSSPKRVEPLSAAIA